MLGLGPGHKILALTLPVEVSALNAAVLWVVVALTLADVVKLHYINSNG